MFGIAARGIPSFGDLAWHKPVQDVAYSALSPTILSPGTGISFAQSLNKSTNGPLSAEPIASAGGLNIGDRLLVTSEASPKNGIWTIFDLGSATSKWILIRATDMDSAAEAPVGSMTYDLSLGGLWVAVGGGTGAWSLAPNQAGSLFMGLAGGVPDLSLVRQSASVLGVENGIGLPAAIDASNLTLHGALAVAGSIAGIGNTTLSGSTTPTLNNGGTATVSGMACRWIQLGPLVVFRLGFSLTHVGSGSTAVTITGTGLPQSGGGLRALGDRSGTGVTAILARMLNAGGELAVNSMALVTTPTTALTGADLVASSAYSFAGAYLTV